MFFTGDYSSPQNAGQTAEFASTGTPGTKLDTRIQPCLQAVSIFEPERPDNPPETVPTNRIPPQPVENSPVFALANLKVCQMHKSADFQLSGRRFTLHTPLVENGRFVPNTVLRSPRLEVKRKA